MTHVRFSLAAVILCIIAVSAAAQSPMSQAQFDALLEQQQVTHDDLGARKLQTCYMSGRDARGVVRRQSPTGYIAIPRALTALAKTKPGLAKAYPDLTWDVECYPRTQLVTPYLVSLLGGEQALDRVTVVDVSATPPTATKKKKTAPPVTRAQIDAIPNYTGTWSTLTNKQKRRVNACRARLNDGLALRCNGQPAS